MPSSLRSKLRSKEVPFLGRRSGEKGWAVVVGRRLSRTASLEIAGGMAGGVVLLSLLMCAHNPFQMASVLYHSHKLVTALAHSSPTLFSGRRLFFG
jgi:hypothetical protein